MAWSTSRGSSSESCPAAGTRAACCLQGPDACLTLQMKPSLLHCLAVKQTQPAIAQHVQAEYHSAAWPGSCYRQLIAENSM